MENSEIFQIWFDPDLSKTLNEMATYDDYKAEDFEIKKNKNGTTKIIKDDDTVFKMSSEGISIRTYHFKNQLNKASIEIRKDKVHSLFIIDGKIELNNQQLEKGTFFKVSESNRLEIKLFSDTVIFEIVSPINPNYKTYANSMA